jgi:hypothetical protein
MPLTALEMEEPLPSYERAWKVRTEGHTATGYSTPQKKNTSLTWP